VRVVGTLEDVGGKTPRYVEETKTHSSRRMLSMPPFLADILAEHLAAEPVSEFVFVGPNGALLRRSNFRRRVWNPALEAAGLDSQLRFHDLRHSAVALLIAQAGPREHHDDAQHVRPSVALARRTTGPPDGGRVPSGPCACGLNVARRWLDRRPDGLGDGQKWLLNCGNGRYSWQSSMRTLFDSFRCFETRMKALAL